MHKPLILVTNDDGITAPGIRNLVEFMNEIGEVIVVAPNSPQSGKGHAITINSTLTFEEINLADNAARTYGVTVGDINGDGWVDIAVANSDDFNLYYLNVFHKE